MRRLLMVLAMVGTLTLPAGAQVVVQAGNYFDNYQVATIADTNNNWIADFGAHGIDLTNDMWINARVFDEMGNSSQADSPQLPQLTVSRTGNWVNGNNWTPESNLDIRVYENQNGSPIHSAITTSTDRYGGFFLELWRFGISIVPGNYIVITDPASGLSKELQITDLSFNAVDFNIDQVMGTAPANTRLSVGFGNRTDYLEFDLFSADDGSWLADFAVHDFDLTLEMGGSAKIYDNDGDATQADYNTPHFGVWPNEERVEGWNWPLGAAIHLEVDDPSTLGAPDSTGDGIVRLAPWDPNQTWFEIFLSDYDLKAGDIATVTDGNTTKTQTIANLALSALDPATDAITGTSAPNTEVHVWADDGSERVTTTTSLGEWSVNFSVGQNGNPVIDLIYGSTGNVWVQDNDYDQTSVWWQIEPPQCLPGNTVTGIVFNHDRITPIPFAHLQFEDFDTGEIRFTTNADQNGQFTCALPEGDYRILALADNFTQEYYNEANITNATRIQVTSSTQLPGVNFTLSSSPAIEHFTFNLDNPLLQDLVVRQAIALGTNRQGILNQAFLPNNIYGMVANSIVPLENWASAPGSELTLYTFDPEQARTILEDAGWTDSDNDGFRENADGVELAFVFKTTTVAFRAASAEIFRQNMEQIGIRITLSNLPAVEFFADGGLLSQGDFDIVEFAWGGGYDDELPMEVYITDNPQNYSGYSNPAFDAAMSNAAVVSSDAEKLPYLIEAQTILTQDLPILPLFTRYGVTPVPTPAGEGVTVSPADYLTVDFESVTESGVTGVITSSVSPLQLPPNFQLLNTIYDIGSSAQFSSAQVCFIYEGANLTPSQESAIRLFHLEDNVWVDATDTGYPDLINNTVCGTVLSFSPFAILYKPNPTDTTPPTITWIGDITNGAGYYFGFVPSEPVCTAFDNLSGVDGPCVVSGYDTSRGTHTLTAMARDKAGNLTEEERTYTVLGWTLKGFYQPVDMNGVYNIVKNGSTVPFKFEIFAGSTELTNIADIKGLTYASISCTINVATDEIETTATGSTSLRYDAGAGQFVYNWKTPNTAGNCYRVTLTTIDGTTLMAYFRLK